MAPTTALAVSRNVPNSVDHVRRQSVLCRVITPMQRLCKQLRLFFGKVNQVLVRLWARVMESSVFGRIRPSRCSADLSDRESCSRLNACIQARQRPNGWTARVQRRGKQFVQGGSCGGRANDRCGGHLASNCVVLRKTQYFQGPSFIP